MFVYKVFYAIGIGTAAILLAAAVYSVYEEWKK